MIRSVAPLIAVFFASCAGSPTKATPDCARHSAERQREFVTFMKEGNQLKISRTPRSLEIYMELAGGVSDLARTLDQWNRREMTCCPHVRFWIMRHVPRVCTVDIVAEKGFESELDLYERLLKE